LMTELMVSVLIHTHEPQVGLACCTLEAQGGQSKHHAVSDCNGSGVDAFGTNIGIEPSTLPEPHTCTPVVASYTFTSAALCAWVGASRAIPMLALVASSCAAFSVRAEITVPTGKKANVEHPKGHVNVIGPQTCSIFTPTLHGDQMHPRARTALANELRTSCCAALGRTHAKCGRMVSNPKTGASRNCRRSWVGYGVGGGGGGGGDGPAVTCQWCDMM
jgi:hypothetical protein